MAVAPSATNSCPYIYPPFSSGKKVSSRLKIQSAASFGDGKPNSNSEPKGEFDKRLPHLTNSRLRQRLGFQSNRITIPSVPYSMPRWRNSIWIGLFGYFSCERSFFIFGNIDREFSTQLCATMVYLDSVDSSKQLYLCINGSGLDLQPAMAIYDTMQNLECPIATHCLGHAHDMAAFILAAGDKGRRAAMPHSRISLQSPVTAARGQASDIYNEASELMQIKHHLYKQLAEKTGQSIKKINEDLQRRKVFNAQEALEYSLIDRIVGLESSGDDAPS